MDPKRLHKGRMHLQKSGRWWPPGSLSPLLIRMGHLKGKSILAELRSSCSQAERPSAPSAPFRMTVSRGLSLSCQVAELRRAFNQQALWPAAPVASPLKELWQHLQPLGRVLRSSSASGHCIITHVSARHTSCQAHALNLTQCMAKDLHGAAL